MSNMHDIARLESAFVRMLERMGSMAKEMTGVMELIGNLNERVRVIEESLFFGESKDADTRSDQTQT